jgi:toxin ParE1/3/4
MTLFRISPRARQDLEDIWLFIAQDNLSAADRFNDLLLTKFKIIAHQPKIGRVREELGPNIRSFSAGNYIIFYRQLKKNVEIVRILHGSRDIEASF